MSTSTDSVAAASITAISAGVTTGCIDTMLADTVLRHV